MGGPFTLPLFISILCALTVIFLITRVRADAPPIFVYFIIPLLVVYIVFQILNTIVPKAENAGNRIGDYTIASLSGNIADTGYFQIFPSLFGLFFLFLVLLAAGFFRI